MNLENKICPQCGRKMRLVVLNTEGSTVTSIICPCCFSDSDTKIDFKAQDFKIFVKCLSIAYKEFCLCERMHDEIKTGLYHKFEQHWNTILVSLEVDYKLWLNKLLEDKKEWLNKDKFDDKYKTIIKKIEMWRGNFFAHFNSSKIRDWKNFREENSLDPKLEIEPLFNKIFNVINYYNNRLKLLPDLKFSFNKLKKETVDECDKWLDNFKEK